MLRVNTYKLESATPQPAPSLERWLAPPRSSRGDEAQSSIPQPSTLNPQQRREEAESLRLQFGTSKRRRHVKTASQAGLVGGFGHWKPGWPRHTTYRANAAREPTSNSAFSGTSGFKGSRLQRLPSAMGFGPRMQIGPGKAVNDISVSWTVWRCAWGGRRSIGPFRVRPITHHVSRFTPHFHVTSPPLRPMMRPRFDDGGADSIGAN
jgi:hypothetical protein